ncbi:MAG: PQQ-binding-like beta-propeller repeat protein [Planctomycetales bacterium]
MAVRIAIWSCVAICGAGAAFAADWPHWRGPSHDDRSSEPSGWTGSRWPVEKKWTAEVGEGASSPIVAKGKLYALGWKDGRDRLVCLDAANGQEIWAQSYHAPQYGRHSAGDKGLYRGVSATPALDADAGLLFTVGIDGELVCWNADDGREAWRLNLYDTFRAGQRPDVGGRRGGQGRRDYGYTSSPLVQGETLIVEAGSPEGALIALDKRTGKKQWASEAREEAGHSGGPVPIAVEGVPCVAVLALRNLLVVRTDGANAGKTVATFPWTTDFANNIPTPAVSGHSLIVTSAYNQFAICRVDVSLNGAKEVWRTKDVASGVCSPIVHDGRIYWAWQGVHCVDFATGKELWHGGSVGAAGSCILTADDRLIVWADRGDLLLAETAKRSPARYTELARLRRIGDADAWPHVVLASGRLYCRDRAGRLTCLAIGGE